MEVQPGKTENLSQITNVALDTLDLTLQSLSLQKVLAHVQSGYEKLLNTNSSSVQVVFSFTYICPA